METSDEYFLRQALAEANAARDSGEVPVGAVIVSNGTIVGRGRNSVIKLNDPTAHAEILALRDAARSLHNYRLTDCEMYSTIEPCAMCAGAIVHARIQRLIYGARDDKAGAVDSHFSLCTSDILNHRVLVQGGVLEDECRAVIQSFFRERRAIADHETERCESG
ncbi:MAG TPA: tRNA adenosine(34) deaminase TadA [Blastocatellia bacterium]|nr:tRNA adenosine(34) deaminase TadA [Blastocatellia bacterium]